MTEAFKYGKSEHHENFFATGNLRIGTLFNYQDASTHGAMVGDKADGCLTVGGEIENPTEGGIRDNRIARRLLRITEKTKIGSLIFENLTSRSENLYIFSTSLIYSAEAHAKWWADPAAQYDSCFRIKCAHIFFRVLSTALLAQQIRFIALDRIYYKADGGVIDINSFLATLKPWQVKGLKSYGNQAEIRGVWQPMRSGPIDYIDIAVPEAVQYCTRHARLK